MAGTSEIVGGRSSGRATIASAYLAQRTREGHVCAWIDVGDDGSPEALMADGADLARLLWVRCLGSGEREAPGRPSALVPRPAGLYLMPAEPGGPTLRERVRTKPGTPSAPNRPLLPRTRVEQVATDRQPARRGMAVLADKNGPPPTPVALPVCAAARKPFAPGKKPWNRLEQAIKAVDLLLQGGGFGAIVLDLGSIAPAFAQRIPLATWFRWRAAGERNRTALIVLTQHGCSGSSAELHLRLEPELPAAGTVLEGLTYRLEVVRRRFAPDATGMERRRKPACACCVCVGEPYRMGLVSGPQDLYGCLVLAEFPAQVIGRLMPQFCALPVAVVEGARPHERVCSVNPRAHALGVTRGMTRTEVESFGAVEILPRSLGEEEAAGRTVLEALGLFSPRVEPRVRASADAAHMAWVVDLSGTARLLGEPAALGARLVEHLDRLGLTGYLAVCPNADAGISLARWAADRNRGEWVQVVAGDAFGDARRDALEDALRPLPISVLDLEAEEVERFQAWGIASLGELARLPEKQLVARTGQRGLHLQMRARGELPHLLEPSVDPFRLEEQLAFDEPVETLEPLLFCLNGMLEDLLARAAHHSLALASVTVTLTVPDSGDRVLGAPVHAAEDTLFTRTIRPAVPTIDRPLLLKMLELDLEAHPAPGPVVHMRVCADPGRSSRVQTGLFAPPLPEPTRFEETHARLRAILGEANIGRVQPMDTHAPNAWTLERFSLPPTLVSAPAPRPVLAEPVTAIRWMRPPAEVRVNLRSGGIESFWFEACRYTVLRCFGPWRVSGDWWRPEEVWSVDSWDLAARPAAETDGPLLLCRIGHDLVRDRWQMEALYD